MSRILVVEDDAAILRGLADNLACESHDVLTAMDGERACSIVREQKPDLVILDLMLPRMSGYDVCRTLRGEGVTTPILMLTARGDESDRVLGLDLGADDYLTKPFSIRELLARVRALLRRTDAAAEKAPPVFRMGSVEIDMGAHRVSRAQEPVHLTKTEWALLESFVAASGKLLTHRWLLEHVWGDGYGDDVEVLRVFVSQLRKKIEPDPQRPRAIITEPGVGYRWSVRPVAEGA